MLTSFCSSTKMAGRTAWKNSEYTQSLATLEQWPVLWCLIAFHLYLVLCCCCLHITERRMRGPSTGEWQSLASSPLSVLKSEQYSYAFQLPLWYLI